MRDHLLAFVEAVQARAAAGAFDALLTLGAAERGTLMFGRGYFDPDKVLWWPPGGGLFQTLPPPAAVDAFLAAYGLDK